MGLFNVLKKKNKEEKTNLELNQDPEELKKDILESKEDIPSLENLPLPPKDELDIPIPNLDETKFEEHEASDIKQEETPIESNKIDDFTTPIQPEEIEENTGEKSPEVQQETEQPVEEPPREPKPSTETKVSEEPDFSLPDFTEEEIKTEERVEELKKTKEKESHVTVIPAPEVQPIMKTTSEEKKTDQYLDINNCKVIFEKINNSQNLLQETKEDIQVHYGQNKIQLQNYKNFHDVLDKVQEKLMEIDRSLFEG